MTRRNLVVSALLFALCPISVSLAQTSSPAGAPELPTAQEASAMGAATAKKVEAFVDYWVKQMLASPVGDQTSKACVSLVNAYGQYDSTAYRLEFARIASERLMPVVAGADRTKASLAASAIVKMPQPSIQPALEKMAVSPVASVRYYAAKGYHDISKTLLLQGGDTQKAMVATLEKLGQDPDGTVVWAAMITLMPASDTRKQDLDLLRGALEKIWSGRMKDLAGGNDKIIDAYLKTARAMTATSDEADKKRLLQMLADAMDAASAAFMNADNQRGDTAMAYKDLLGTLEQKAAEILGADKLPLQAIVYADKPNDRIANDARLAVVETWVPAFKAKGVTPHALPAGVSAPAATASSGPSPAAAGKPASAPATR